MGVRSFKLVVLLAAAVALSPVRASVTNHEFQSHHDGHGHSHEHAHGDAVHSHGHHHHDDHDDGDADDHHGVIDHLPDAPKLSWTGPRRTDVDPPPTLSAAAVVEFTSNSGWRPTPRAKPPPRSDLGSQPLNSIRTIILRL